VNDFGVIGGNHISTAQGAITTTSNTLDVAIEGEGFFQIQTAEGPQFTRDGAFTRLSNGMLAAASGEPVMTVQGKPLVIPTGDISIGSDGVVSVGGAVAGQIGVFNFKDSSLLVPQGKNRYTSEPGAKPVLSQATLHQGALESSNQDIIQGSLQMILVQRQAEMMQKALSIFHTDFDKTASEELPRV
jgi:flagellar basal-body rod protein FlgF